ncbi:AAA family ATPase [Methylorubrum populi]
MTKTNRKIPRAPAPPKRRQAEHPADEFGTLPNDDTFASARTDGLRPACDTLPMIALAEALGPAGVRRLREDAGLALVVEVPSADWAHHIELALRQLCEWAHVYVRTGASRSFDKPSNGSDHVGNLLGAGARVAGISQAPTRYLPSALVAAADIHARVRQPSNRAIAFAIREATGKRVRRLPSASAAGLDLDTIFSCIRVGTTPADCVARLKAAQAQGVGDALLADVPALEDMHGYGAAMDWSQALVRDLDAWRGGRLAWHSISRCALWTSEPGLGKSTLARAVAKASGLPLIATSVAEWFQASDGYLGGVLRTAELAFQQAATRAPAILFLDEIDAIPDRARLDARGRDFWTPLITYLLTALDGSTSGPASRLVVIGATNHASSLDAALVRPGRLHPVIRIKRPDATALAAIFRGHLGADLPDADLTGVAHMAAGASGADVVAWVKQARSTARAAARRMILADLTEAVAPPDERSPDELRVIARHEVAHAVAAVELDVGVLRSVSIAAGHTHGGSTQAVAHARTFLTRAQSEALTIVALAGRAMDIIGGAPNSGAGGGPGSDLARATALVAFAHASLGLGETLIHRGGPDDVERALHADPALRRAVERDLQRLQAEALSFVRSHRTVIEAVADRLFAERVLSGDEVVRLVRQHTPAKANRSVRIQDAR